MSAWALAWGRPGLESRVTIRFRYGMRRSLGRCAPSRKLIHLSTRLRHRWKWALAEVLCHELAHAAAHELYGRHRPHGREWGELMRAVGYPARTHVPWEDRPAARVRAMAASARRKLRQLYLWPD